MRTFWSRFVFLLLVLGCLPSGSAIAKTPAARRPAIVLEPYTDRTEKAFLALVPRGWSVAGGIVRVDPSAAGGPAQSIEAKLDFTIRKDATGTVMLRWHPTSFYIDLRGQPAAGMFPAGSNYSGMMVLPLPSAEHYLSGLAFPYLHPGAQNVKVLRRERLPKIAEGCKAFSRKLLARAPIPLEIGYDAALVEVAYDEGGVRYRERLFTVIENLGPAAGGIWANRFSFQARAPEAEFAAWEPVGSVIAGSLQLDARWLAGELRGQIQRQQIAIQTQQDLQAIENEIVEHRRQVNAEIRHDTYLTLTDQEDFKNPFTNRIETGSNQWARRWVDASGRVIYSDDTGYDPNTDPDLGLAGFQLSKVRAR
jgi:hypothetical protein